MTSIMVVEDEAIVALDLAQQLTDMGYAVVGTADNAAEALRLATAGHPDLVLMDIVIKGPVDGIGAAEELQRRLQIPVVFLTAYSDSGTVERAAHAAPYGYLTKPYQPRELRAVIEVALYKSRLERELRASERWFAATLRCVGDAVIACDPDGRIRFMNPAAEAGTGWTQERAIGRAVEQVFPLHTPDGEIAIECPMRRALRDDRVVGIEFGSRLQTADRGLVPIDDCAAPIRDAAGQLLGGVLVFRDVSQRVDIERQLRESESRFRTAFESAPLGMALVDADGHIRQVNEALGGLLELPVERLPGTRLTAFTLPEDRDAEQAALARLEAGDTGAVQLELRYRRTGGASFWSLTAISVLDSGHGHCFLYQLSDISARKAMEARLAEQATRDELTGLLNRAGLCEALEQRLADARRYPRQLALLFLDLDRFKAINDRYGHEAGDRMLQAVAQRLRGRLRESDLIARLGGDEFVVVLSQIDSGLDVMKVSSQLLAAIIEPLAIGGQTCAVGVSIGAALFPDDGHDAQTLLRQADQALYEAKHAGGNRLSFYRQPAAGTMPEHPAAQPAGPLPDRAPGDRRDTAAGVTPETAPAAAEQGHSRPPA